MTNEQLNRTFARMGARVSIDNTPPRWGVSRLAINVLRDRSGEYFHIDNSANVELQVLDVRAQDRHLLLMSREGRDKHRYLLGHDERHWFVAGVPESTPVSNVRDAKDALKPDAVRLAEIGLDAATRNRRHNKARHRQGEWFFVPDPNFIPPSDWRFAVLRNEPISRGRGSKPHVCEELYRSGGEDVYVSGGAYSGGITEGQYIALGDRERRRHNWTVMKRNPDVWVRGAIRHPDHATLHLNGWHKVVSNTEHLSYAMRHITFLD